MTDEQFRATRALYEAAMISTDTITSLAAQAGLSQPSLSTYLHGGTFGRGVRERSVAPLGRLLGVRMPSLPASLSDDDERIAVKAAADGYVQVFDRPMLRAFVGHESTGDLLSVPRFLRRFAEGGRRWVELPPEAKLVCASVGDWIDAHPREEAAS
jgi:hypothetical protein